jgi:hypothetical protein
MPRPIQDHGRPERQLMGEGGRVRLQSGPSVCMVLLEVPDVREEGGEAPYGGIDEPVRGRRWSQGGGCRSQAVGGVRGR